MTVITTAIMFALYATSAVIFMNLVTLSIIVHLITNPHDYSLIGLIQTTIYSTLYILASGMTAATLVQIYSSLYRNNRLITLTVLLLGLSAYPNMLKLVVGSWLVQQMLYYVRLLL